MENKFSIDFLIILSLLENPLASAVELTARVNSKMEKKEISESTIKRRLRYLVEYYDDEIVEKVIKNNFDKKIKPELMGVIKGSIAQINYDVIDLQIHSFLLIPNLKNWKFNIDKIGIFCDNHPYTLFHSKVFGNKNAIFTQFILPKKHNSLEHLIFAFDSLIKLDILIDFECYSHTRNPLMSKSNLNDWSEETGKWLINFDRIKNTINGNLVYHRSNIMKQSNIVNNLTLFDNIIIREMTKNAMRSQIELLSNIPKVKYYKNVLSDLPLSKQSLSRRLNKLKELNIFSNYTLSYDRKRFGMFNQVLYIFDSSYDDIGGLSQCIKDKIIPFPGSLYETDKSWILWLNLPPVEMVELTQLISNKFPNMRYFIFARDSRRYYFWSDNYDINTKYWKVSRKYIANDVIDSISK